MSEDEIAELVTKTEQSMNTQKKMFDCCYLLFQLFEEYLQEKRHLLRILKLRV